MYHIDEKIKSWYKNNNNVPVVKEDTDNENKNTVKAYTSETNNAKSNKNSSRDNLKNAIIGYKQQLDALQKIKDEEGIDYSKVILTDKEIKEKAQEMADETYNPKYESEYLKNQTENRKLNSERENIILDENLKKSKIDDIYKNNYMEITDKAIKNGISRSTIYDGEAQRNDSERIEELLQVESDTKKAIEENQSKAEEEKKRHSISIDTINLNKQKEYERNVDKLKEQRNALIASGEGASGVNLLNAPTPEMIEVQKKIISEVLNYYYSMDRDKAIEEYNSDLEIQQLLGDMEPSIRIYVTGKSSIKK